MFDKEQAKDFRKRFWTGFGKHMGRHQSALGRKQKWLNYRTGVRHMFFRLHADSKTAMVSIDLQHPEPDIRDLFFDQWEEYQNLLHNLSGTLWKWERSYLLPEGGEISRIHVDRAGLNMYAEDDWLELWTWFEPILLGLDMVWEMAVDNFQDLSK